MLVPSPIKTQVVSIYGKISGFYYRIEIIIKHRKSMGSLLYIYLSCRAPDRMGTCFYISREFVMQ